MDLCPPLQSALSHFLKACSVQTTHLSSLPVGTILFNLWKSMSLQSLVLSNNKMCPKLKQSFSRKPLPHSDPPQISWQWQGCLPTRSQIPGRSSISPFCSHCSIGAVLSIRKSPRTFLLIPTDNLPATIPILAFPTHTVRPRESSLWTYLVASC